VISRVELIRKDKEKFRSARKIPPSGKQALVSRMTYIDLDIRECAEEAAFTLF
jgi:hypothetical protein